VGDFRSLSGVDYARCLERSVRGGGDVLNGPLGTFNVLNGPFGTSVDVSDVSFAASAAASMPKCGT
jgi:hypothetical protein